MDALVIFEQIAEGGGVEDAESTSDTTEMMSPLPPVSWFKTTETFCGRFRKPCNEDHQDEEDPFFDCWDGKEQFDATRCERLPLSELPCLFFVPEAESIPTSANETATV